MENIILQEGDTKSFESLTIQEMDRPIKHFEKELLTIRTGRASTALIENIKVECYGQFMSLRDLATLSAPESRLLTIQPWDKGSIADIEKAIRTSDLGATPINDGSIIRIQLPQMSTARRDELTKVVHKKTEESKIGVRTVRKDFHNEIKQAQQKHAISEDFAHRLTDILQKITDQYIAKIDDMAKKKEAELHIV